ASDCGSSIFTELLPGRTTLCESPATTSTSSGGSAVRFTTAGGATAWEAGAAVVERVTGFEGAGAGALRGREAVPELVPESESQSCAAELSEEPNQTGASLMRITARAPSRMK